MELFNFSFFSITGQGIDLDYRDIEWFALETNRDFSVVFETASKYLISDSLQTHRLYSPWDSPGQNTGVGKLFTTPGDLPNPGIKPRSPALLADSLPAEPQGKTFLPKVVDMMVI